MSRRKKIYKILTVKILHIKSTEPDFLSSYTYLHITNGILIII